MNGDTSLTIDLDPEIEEAMRELRTCLAESRRLDLASAHDLRRRIDQLTADIIAHPREEADRCR